jgi:hypothetical protein
MHTSQEDIMLSILLTICGVYFLVAGKAPGVFFGQGRSHLEGSTARLIGAALALACPLSFLLSRALPMLFGEDILMFAAAVEIGAVLLAFTTACAMGRMSSRQIVRL